jgi:hypothetical protein
MATTFRKRDHRQIMAGGMVIWAAVVALFFLWEIVQYHGAMALLAEWQFNTFGHYYPSVTYLALVAALASPGLLLFMRVRRRDSEQRLAAATLRSATVFRRIVLGIGVACLLAAFATLLLALALPTSAGGPRRIDLGQPIVALPEEGATMIDGAILYDRTTAFNEDLVIARRNLRFAPIVPPRSATSDLQFFVELPSASAPQAAGAGSMTGVLKKNALPGEILQLYRYAGYRVEPPYFVLFASEEAMRWPYFKVASELGIIALLFLTIGLWQHRRVKWLENAVRPAPEKIGQPPIA